MSTFLGLESLSLLHFLISETFGLGLDWGDDGLASFRCRLVWGGSGLLLPEVFLYFSA